MSNIFTDYNEVVKNLINKEDFDMEKTMRLVFAPTDGREGELIVVRKFKNKNVMYATVGLYATLGWSLIEIWEKAEETE